MTVTKHRYSTLTEEGEVTSVTWYTDVGESHTVTSDHPHFRDIRVSLATGAPHEKIMKLYSNRQRVNEYFNSVGLYGVVFNGSTVFVMGKPVPSELSALIIKHVDDGTDPTPLVRFFKNLNENPSYQSKKELVSFIVRHGLTITEEGYFIAYKGLRADSTSVHSGPAFINGEAFRGHVPNVVGNVISLPRGEVDDDRTVACSTGLHAGTWRYASGFGVSGNTARVKINPADVISVPSDSNEQKLRVCRYEVVEAKLKEATQSLLWNDTATTTLWRDGIGETHSTTSASNADVLWSA